jgi:hypothetical protein
MNGFPSCGEIAYDARVVSFGDTLAACAPTLNLRPLQYPSLCRSLVIDAAWSGKEIARPRGLRSVPKLSACRSLYLELTLQLLSLSTSADSEVG